MDRARAPALVSLGVQRFFTKNPAQTYGTLPIRLAEKIKWKLSANRAISKNAPLQLKLFFFLAMNKLEILFFYVYKYFLIFEIKFISEI